VTLRPAQDRDQLAEGMHDTVAGRLFSAGLALEVVAGLIGDHRAAGKVQEAISELDLAVRDLRDMVFDHHRPDLPTAGRRD
jgi:signal transduction histidine kinase